MKIKKKKNPHTKASWSHSSFLAWSERGIFFSFPCFLASRLVKWVHHTAGKTRASLLEFVWLQSYVGERESGQCVSSFLKVWVKEVHNTTLFIWFCFQCREHGFWWLQRCMWSPLAPHPVIPLKRWSDWDNWDLLWIPQFLLKHSDEKWCVIFPVAVVPG